MRSDTTWDRLLLWLAARFPVLAPRLRAAVDDHRLDRAIRRSARAAEALRSAVDREHR